MDSDVWVVTFVGKEWRDSGSSGRGIVVCKFGERKKSQPINLLIIAINVDELLEGLICSLCLSVAFQVVTRSEMEVDVEDFSKGLEKMQDEFGTSIGNDIFGNSMFRENLFNKDVRNHVERGTEGERESHKLQFRVRDCIEMYRIHCTYLQFRVRD